MARRSMTAPSKQMTQGSEETADLLPRSPHVRDGSCGSVVVQKQRSRSRISRTELLLPEPSEFFLGFAIPRHAATELAPDICETRSFLDQDSLAALHRRRKSSRKKQHGLSESPSSPGDVF